MISGVFLIPCLGALHRLLGSSFSIYGGQVTRLVTWSLPCAVWGFDFGLIPGLAAFIGAWLGRLIPHGWAFGDTKPLHVLGMSCIGLARTYLIMSGFLYLHPEMWFLGLLGALTGLMYYLGIRYLTNVTHKIVICGFDVTPDGQAWAEIGTGMFAQGLPLALALILIGG